MCKKEEPITLVNDTEKLSKTRKKEDKESLSFVSFWYSIPVCVCLTYGTLQFALTFPFILWHKGAADTYVRAEYQYDAINTRFDNTIWTYGTDYWIAIFMLSGAIHCWRCAQGFTTLRVLSSGLLVCYFTSVLFGGYAHQYFLTLDSLNTTSFRIVWIMCVGTVTLAGGFIGAIGTELAKKLHGMNRRVYVPILPQYFWALYGIYLTVVCAMGGISFKRPACDIFIAGTTQTPPTFYTVLIILSAYWDKSPTTENPVTFQFLSTLQKLVSSAQRNIFLLAFILNAPLLPAYPILLSLGLKLGTVNTILHCNLFLAWNLQYWSLMRFCSQMQDSYNIVMTKRV